MGYGYRHGYHHGYHHGHSMHGAYPQHGAYPHQPQGYPPPMGYPGHGGGHPRRYTAPPSVHVVALIGYLVGLLSLLGAAAVGYFTLVAKQDIDTSQLGSQAADLVKTFAGALVALAAVLAVIGLIWLVVARKLQRGRQWARILVIVLSVLSFLGTFVQGLQSKHWTAPLVGQAVFPILFVILLNTRAARSWFRYHTY